MNSNVTVSSTNAVIENEFVKLVFDPGNAYRLISVKDMRSECELIRDPGNPGALFRMEIINDDPRITKTFLASDAGSLTASDKDGELLLEVSDFAMSDLRIGVRVRLDEGMSYWKIEYDLPTGWHVRSITCPVVTGLFIPGNAAEGECVAFPCLGEGYLFRDPFPMIDGLPVKSGSGPDRKRPGLGNISGISPGFASTQMMLYYNDNSGLYIAAHDSRGDVKNFAVGVDTVFGGNPVMSITHFPQRGGEMEYESVVGVFKGDWYDGADIYKKWARVQPWANGLMKNRRLPEWMRKGFAVFQMTNYWIPENDELWNTMDGIADFVNKVADEAKVPMAGLAFNYEKGGAWTGPVGIFPPRDETFASAMKKMADAGNPGFVYIPFGNWYANIPYSEPYNSEKEFYEEASHYAMRNKYGDAALVNGVYGWKMANLCPAGDGVYKLTMDILNGLADLGCKIIQLDNWPIVGAIECFGEKHGHPLGYGRWYTEEYVRVMKDILDAMHMRDPEIALTSECITEQFLQSIHFFDQRAGNQEYFGHWITGMPAGAELIPMFNYIYNPVVGSYLAAYPECGLRETTYWNRSVALSVCQGVIPASGIYVGGISDVNECCLKYFEKVARITAEILWDFITYGEMLRAPVTDAPVVEMPYIRLLSLISTNAEDKTDLKREHDYQFAYNKAVETGAFATDDGREAYLFFNIVDVPQSITVFVPTIANVKLTKFNDGVKVGEIIYPETGKMLLELKPLEVIILIKE